MKRNAILIAALSFIAIIIVGGVVILNQNDSVSLAPALRQAALESEKAPSPQPVSTLTDEERAAVFQKFMSPPPPFIDEPGHAIPWAEEGVVPDGYGSLLLVNDPLPGSDIRTYVPIPCLNKHAQVVAECLIDSRKPAFIFRVTHSDAPVITKIASINPAMGGNYGGIFMPQAITPDGKSIILRAWMGSPGAGGSQIDFGYSTINATPYDHLLESAALPRLASKYAIFYDEWSKVISLEEGKNAPDWSQPGRSPNQAKIVYRNLLTGEMKTVAAEAETTYEFADFDAAGKKLEVQSQKHAYGSDCPPAQITLDCSTVSATNASIDLP